MTDEEALAFLDEQRTVICATNGHDGFPHLMPLWYVVARRDAVGLDVREVPEDQEPRARPARDAAGRGRRRLRPAARADAAHGGRACTATTRRELAFVAELAARYAPPGVDPEAMRAGFAQQVPKRVAIEFAELGRVSWDHRKLGGTTS